MQSEYGQKKVTLPLGFVSFSFWQTQARHKHRADTDLIHINVSIFKALSALLVVTGKVR